VPQPNALRFYADNFGTLFITHFQSKYRSFSISTCSQPLIHLFALVFFLAFVLKEILTPFKITLLHVRQRTVFFRLRLILFRCDLDDKAEAATQILKSLLLHSSVLLRVSHKQFRTCYHFVPRLKKEYSYNSTPSLGLHGLF
jgi:hypothetical protein